MMKMIITHLMLFCIVTSCVQVVAGDAKGDATKVKAGIDAAKGISDLLQSDHFIQSVKDIGKNIAPFLGAIGPAVALITLFLPTSPSAELTAIKEGFAATDAQFDNTFTKLDDLRNFVEESAVRQQYSGCETVILNTARELNKLFDVDPSNSELVNQRTQTILAFYERSFADCAHTLWTGVVNENLIFAQNIPKAAMSFTNNHRQKVADLMAGVTQLILIGVKVQLAYFKLKGLNAVFEEEETLWTSNIEQMLTHIVTIDGLVRDKYDEQSKMDVMNITAKMQGESNSALAEAAYDILDSKYYWRDWFMVVYNDISGPDSNTYRICNGHKVFHHHGFNVVFASMDRNRQVVDLTNIRKDLFNVKTTYNNNFKLGAYYIYQNYVPSYMKESCLYDALGLVERTADPQVRAAPNRAVITKPRFYVITTFR